MSGVTKDQYSEEILEVVALAAPFGGIVAGGAARWLWMAENRVPLDPKLAPGDIDVFMLEGGNRVRLYSALHDAGWVLQRRRESTVTFKRADFLDVQVVRANTFAGQRYSPWYSVSAIVKQFAFTVEMFWVNPPGEALGYSSAAAADLKTRTLRVNHVLDPIRVAWRVGKYTAKGFTVTPSALAGVFEVYGAASTAQRAIWHERDLRAEREGVAYDVGLDRDALAGAGA